VESLRELLSRSAACHQQLCPRQVLGVRMGMLAGKALNLDLPQTDKRLFAFVECDGCGMGGIAVATGCLVERRTMRVLDYGKLAATFVDTQTGESIRIKPQPQARAHAEELLPDKPSHWHSHLEAYQIMTDNELFIVESVELALSLDKIISQPGLRVICTECGEEISNEREVVYGGKILCCFCAGDRYYVREQDGFPTLENDQNPIPLITVIGKSKSGKTTLIENVVRELSARGYRIATIKHHSHSGFEIDYPGKDSWRFAQARSQQVVIAAPDKLASYQTLDHEMSLDDIASEIKDVDLILVEGYRQSNKPCIEVLRSANSSKLIGPPEHRIALVTDMDLDVAVPKFNLDDFQGIIDFILEYMTRKEGGA
jgi:formylmethanofuran dehydrogenase subunit E